MKTKESNKHTIVQIGFDEDIFNENAAQDSRSRQLSYGRQLKKKDENAHLVTIVLTNKTTFKKEEFENVTFIPCNYFRLRHIPSLLNFLRKIHRDIKISLVTTQDIHGIFWGGALFSVISNVPIVGQIHYDLSSKYARNEWFVEAYGRFYEKLVLRLIRFFDGVRVVNNSTKEYLGSLNYKGEVAVCPVPISTFTTSQDHTYTGWKYPYTLHVLYVGRFVSFKNIDCWVETAKESLLNNQNIEFTLVGEGEERERIEAYCEKLGISHRVQFTGALTPEEVANWYASADVLLLTSFYEGFGRVLIEAMNYKVVPVCTDVAGPEDILTHGIDGYLDEANPAILAKYLVELETNREKLKAMGNNARDMVEDRYSSGKLRKCWIDFLLSFIKISPGNTI